MNWYRISQQTKPVSDIMYHNTKRELVPKILKEGLKINSPYVKSRASQWFIYDIYGLNPIFLSLSPHLFFEPGDETLIVNVNGLKLVADIPSLTHYGAYYSESNDSIWFKENEIPEPLKPFDIDNDGTFYYQDLLDPLSELTRTCINLTKSAACLENISPKRIKKYELV